MKPPPPSRLLINESPLMVLPGLAATIGLNEAMFLQQLHFWLEASGKEKTAQDDSPRYWIFNTYSEWKKQFPFWSERTIMRIVATLRDELAVVITTNEFNKHNYDQTLWYSINYDKLNDIANVTTCHRGIRQVVIEHPDKVAEPIPEITTEITNREHPSHDPDDITGDGEVQEEKEAAAPVFAIQDEDIEPEYMNLLQLHNKLGQPISYKNLQGTLDIIYRWQVNGIPVSLIEGTMQQRYPQYEAKNNRKIKSLAYIDAVICGNIERDKLKSQQEPSEDYDGEAHLAYLRQHPDEMSKFVQSFLDRISDEET